jgi:hypothetical protein
MTSAHVAARPRLRHGTIISRSHENAVLAMVGDTCYDISVEEGSKETLLELKRYLDGTYTPEQIAASLGLPEEDVVEVVETFARLDLLADPVRTDRVARESFLRKIDQTVTMWRRQISYHPLFAALETGNARVEVLHGLMIETSHFVRSAPTHIATALAHCTDPRWRAMLTNYLVEECDHERYVLQVTTAMGYDPERVRSANPVIGTTSLIANLCTRNDARILSLPPSARRSGGVAIAGHSQSAPHREALWVWAGDRRADRAACAHRRGGWSRIVAR